MEFDNGKHELGDEYIVWLKEHGYELGLKAAKGDKLALNIARIYTLYFNWPEQAAAGLLESAIDEFKERQ